MDIINGVVSSSIYHVGLGIVILLLLLLITKVWALLNSDSKGRQDITVTVWTSLNSDSKGRQNIKIVTTVDECRQAISLIRSHCNEYNILGFDCEWHQFGAHRNPVALLQLCTHRGLCVLFRLCELRHIPVGLRNILEDDEIVKVGVQPKRDGIFLSKDYNVGVKSTLDLRYLACLIRAKAESLEKMVKTHLGVEKWKGTISWASDWEATTLSEEQIKYAANDAYYGIELFRALNI